MKNLETKLFVGALERDDELEEGVMRMVGDEETLHGTLEAANYLARLYAEEGVNVDAMTEEAVLEATEMWKCPSFFDALMGGAYAMMEIVQNLEHETDDELHNNILLAATIPHGGFTRRSGE